MTDLKLGVIEGLLEAARWHEAAAAAPHMQPNREYVIAHTLSAEHFRRLAEHKLGEPF